MTTFATPGPHQASTTDEGVQGSTAKAPAPLVDDRTQRIRRLLHAEHISRIRGRRLADEAARYRRTFPAFGPRDHMIAHSAAFNTIVDQARVERGRARYLKRRAVELIDDRTAAGRAASGSPT